MGYVSKKLLEEIVKRWGKMPKKQIAKELEMGTKLLNGLAQGIAYGRFKGLKLPKTERYGPYDDREKIEFKVGGKKYAFTVPDYDWPKKEGDIEFEIRKVLKDKISEIIFIGSIIHHASKRNLRNKDGYLKNWKKTYDGLVGFESLLE